MTVNTLATPAGAPSHRVRELICTYRPLRDAEGRIVGTSTRTLSAPSMAATTWAPLIADQVVEVVATIGARASTMPLEVLDDLTIRTASEIYRRCRIAPSEPGEL